MIHRILGGKKLFIPMMLALLLAVTPVVAGQTDDATLPPLTEGDYVELPVPLEQVPATILQEAEEIMRINRGMPNPPVPADYRIEAARCDFLDTPDIFVWILRMFPTVDQSGGLPAYAFAFSEEGYSLTDYGAGWGDDPPATLWEADMAYYIRQHGLNALWGPFMRWSMEQSASLTAWGMEIGAIPEGKGFYAMPDAGDLPPEQAVQIARKAIVEDRGWEESRFECESSLLKGAGQGKRHV